MFRSLADKTAQLDSALAKIRQLEINGATAEEDLDLTFSHYMKAKKKKKAAEKRLEEVEKSFKHVVESVYLRESKESKMKKRLGRMEELSETVEEAVDDAPKNTPRTENSPRHAIQDVFQALSRKNAIKLGEEEEEKVDWLCNEPPGWPHFAIQDGADAQLSRNAVNFCDFRRREGGFEADQAY